MNIFKKFLGLFRKEKNKQIRRIEEKEFADLFDVYMDIGPRTVRTSQHAEIRFLLLNQLCPDRKQVRDLCKIAQEPHSRERMMERIKSDKSVAPSLQLKLDHRRITKGSDADAKLRAAVAEGEMVKIQERCSHEYPTLRFVYRNAFVAPKSQRQYRPGDEKLECENCGKIVKNTAKERDERENSVQLTIGFPA